MNIELRDWFAGMAMAGFAANSNNSSWKGEEIATDAYAYADAMLEKRKKQKPKKFKYMGKKEILNTSIKELDLSTRATNSLMFSYDYRDPKKTPIITIGQLCMATEEQLNRRHNFGKTSLNEIKDKLHQLGLGLGQKFPRNWVKNTDTKGGQE